MPLRPGVLFEPFAQSLRHLVHRLKPIGGIAGHHLPQQNQQSLTAFGFAEFRTDHGGRFRLSGLMPQQSLSERAVAERRVSGQPIVDRTAEAVDVGPAIDLMAVQSLFGRQIVRRAQHLFVVQHRQRILFRDFLKPGQPQIEHFDDTTAIDQQIAGLHIAMHQSAVMRMGQPQRGLTEVFRRVFETERPVFADDVLNAAAVDVLHDQEVNLAVALHFLIDIVRADNIGVIERSDGLRFSMKTRQIRRIPDPLDGQHLDRAASPHQHMLGQINGTHAAFAEQRQQAVLAEREAFVPSLQQLVGLPARQLLLFHQSRGYR